MGSNSEDRIKRKHNKDKTCSRRVENSKQIKPSKKRAIPSKSDDVPSQKSKSNGISIAKKDLKKPKVEKIRKIFVEQVYQLSQDIKATFNEHNKVVKYCIIDDNMKTIDFIMDFLFEKKLIKTEKLGSSDGLGKDKLKKIIGAEYCSRKNNLRVSINSESARLEKKIQNKNNHYIRKLYKECEPEFYKPILCEKKNMTRLRRTVSDNDNDSDDSVETVKITEPQTFPRQMVQEQAPEGVPMDVEESCEMQQVDDEADRETIKIDSDEDSDEEPNEPLSKKQKIKSDEKLDENCEKIVDSIAESPIREHWKTQPAMTDDEDEDAEYPEETNEHSETEANETRKDLIEENPVKCYFNAPCNEIPKDKTAFSPPKDCEEILHNMPQLESHLTDKHMMRVYQCKYNKCEEKFETMKKLHEHEIKVHGKERSKIHCFTCGIDFESADHLGKHYMRHHFKSKYHCPFDGCSYWSDTRAALSVHKSNVHRNMVCHLCNKRFATFSGISQHLIVHVNQAPYRCKLEGCETSSKYKGNMVVHVRKIHFGLPATLKEQKEKGIIDFRDPSICIITEESSESLMIAKRDELFEAWKLIHLQKLQQQQQHHPA